MGLAERDCIAAGPAAAAQVQLPLIRLFHAPLAVGEAVRVVWPLAL